MNYAQIHKATLLLVLFTSSLAARVSMAHDLEGLISEDRNTPATSRAIFTEIDKTRAVLAGRSSTGGDAKGLEGVIQKSLAWKKKAITVCFMDGNANAWKQIQSVASQWTDGLLISFDFGTDQLRKCVANKHSDIRVTFEGSGNWSYVGTKAKFIDEKSPTLGVASLGGGSTFSEDQKATVLHEFGHALGLEHEHQSPVADCESQFNWNYLYKWLGALGWDKAKVDLNMRKLTQNSDEGGLYATPFDNKSIMLYSLPKQVFLGDKASCFIPQKNLSISEVDRQTIATVYPKEANAPASSLQDIDPAVLDSIQYLGEQTGK